MDYDYICFIVGPPVVLKGIVSTLNEARTWLNMHFEKGHQWQVVHCRRDYPRVQEYDLYGRSISYYVVDSGTF